MGSNETVRKILGILERGKAGVTEIARAVGVSKSTVSYHLERLQKEGIVEKTEDGLYKLKEDSKLIIVLKALKDAIIEEAERKVDKRFTTVKIDKIVVKTEELGVKNGDGILNYLISLRYAQKVKEDEVALTPIGAEMLEVCPIYLEEFKDEERVLRIIDFYTADRFHRYMIHLRCHRYAIEEPIFDEYSADKDYAYCAYCGLPLDREFFLELRIPKVTPEDLIEHLTDEEIIALHEDYYAIVGELFDRRDVRVLATYEDVREFVAKLYALKEDGTISEERVKELKEREDVKKRAAQLYREVWRIRKEYIKKANEIFDQLLDPIGRACGLINVWWHKLQPLTFKFDELIDPYRDISRQSLVIKTEEGFFHPYCYERYKAEKNQKL